MQKKRRADSSRGQVARGSRGGNLLQAKGGWEISSVVRIDWTNPPTEETCFCGSTHYCRRMGARSHILTVGWGASRIGAA